MPLTLSLLESHLFKTADILRCKMDATEQQILAKQIMSYHGRLHCEDSKLQRLNKRKSGLMDNLLTGRVCVTPLLEAITVDHIPCAPSSHPRKP